MDKQELIDAIARKASLTKAESRKALDAFMVAVHSTLMRGEKVSLVGWGTLEVHRYKQRTWKNKRGKTVVVPSRKHVHFVEGEELDAALNFDGS